MIKIEGNNVKIIDLTKILKGDPIEAIFESLKLIWHFNGSNLANYYQKGERLTSKFEKIIFNVFSEIYNIIIEKGISNNVIKEILSKEKFCLIIMDGMSIREVSLLLNKIDNYEISFQFTYSALPSETQFFTKKYFNARSPSQIRGKRDYKYVHLQRDDKIEDIPLNEKKMIIWSTYPDQMFSYFKNGFESQDLEKIGRKTVKILLNLIKYLIRSREIIITSDHGYFIDTYSWNGIDDYFTGERYALKVPDPLKRFYRKVNNYWILIGRYNTIKRGRYVHLRHGGLSFLETIIPLIKIKEKGG